MIFNLASRQRNAELVVVTRQQALAGVKLNLIGQVVASYYTILAQQQQFELYQGYLADLVTLQQIRQQEFAAGLTDSLAIKQVVQQINEMRIQQNIIERNWLASQNALRYLLNQNPGQLKLPRSFVQVKTAYAPAAAVPASVIGNRPDVALAAVDYQLANQGLTTEYTKLLPNFTLDYGPAMVQVGASNTPNGTPASFQDEYVMWSLNPGLFGSIAAQSATVTASYHSYIDTVRQALRQVSDDLAANRINNQTTDFMQQAGNAAQENYSLIYQLYQAGTAAYVSTLPAKINQDVMAIAYSQSRLNQLLTVVKLYQDLGGGVHYAESAVQPAAH